MPAQFARRRGRGELGRKCFGDNRQAGVARTGREPDPPGGHAPFWGRTLLGGLTPVCLTEEMVPEVFRNYF
jgi:hypothetical protein